ncbi:MAG TPA: FAD-dependent oxidoreductase [Gemmatimonadaceae bacterium]|jgi:thioredoxin reductase|nr:FAD-dependent oxidoreductase [Gemmatimonadaceae bacterium]
MTETSVGTHAVYDVAIIGAGPAGIAAAVRAAEAGGAGGGVVVIDEGLGPGGQIWRHRYAKPPARRAAQWIARLDATRADVLRATSVVDVRASRGGAFVIRAERVNEQTDIVAKRIVLATGARELFLPFPGWTLPGVFGIGGVQALLKSGLSVRGKRIVIGGSGPLLLPVAASLARAGARLLIVAEQAPAASVFGYARSLWNRPAMLAQAASLRLQFARAKYATDAWIERATGDSCVREATIRRGASSSHVACDVVCTGFGLVPNVELARVIGCSVSDNAIVVDPRQETTVSGVFAAGEPTGIGGVDLALIEGEIAGAAALGERLDSRLVARRAALADGAERMRRAFRVRDEVRCLATPETTVCRCEDVQSGALDRRWSARQAKLYTRAGMGSCQGRICGAALECLMGWPTDSVRPPVQPARISTLLAEPPSTEPLLTEPGVH